MEEERTETGGPGETPVPDAEDAVGVQRSPENLTRIARGQRRVLIGILLYVGLAAGQFLLGDAGGVVLLSGIAAAMLFVLYSVFTLASELFGRGKGVLLTLVALIPFVGLLVLLVVNAYATQLLNAYGYRVGLLGAYEPKQH